MEETITLAEIAALLGVKTLDYVRAELRKAKIVPLPGTAPGLANRFPRATALAWVEKRKAARRAPSPSLSPRKQESIEQIQRAGNPALDAVLASMRLKLDLAEAAVRDAEAEAAKWRTAIEAVEAIA